uniref:Uncharacterized protein n=1 Tax=Sphaerodactylus townsendi TaxID=933632 RepID=A0ACB8FJI7_9SAUR
MDSPEEADSCYPTEPVWRLTACCHKCLGMWDEGAEAVEGTVRAAGVSLLRPVHEGDVGDSWRPHSTLMLCLPSFHMALPVRWPLLHSCCTKASQLLRCHSCHHTNHFPLLGPAGGGQEVGIGGVLLFPPLGQMTRPASTRPAEALSISHNHDFIPFIVM